MSFSCSALFGTKTRVCLKYFVNDSGFLHEGNSVFAVDIIHVKLFTNNLRGNFFNNRIRENDKDILTLKSSHCLDLNVICFPQTFNGRLCFVTKMIFSYLTFCTMICNSWKHTPTYIKYLPSFDTVCSATPVFRQTVLVHMVIVVPSQ